LALCIRGHGVFAPADDATFAMPDDTHRAGDCVRTVCASRAVALRIAAGPPEVRTVPASIRNEGDNRYRVDVSGMLRKSEMDNAQAALAREMARVGKARLLFVLDRFEGWEKGADWGDMRFYEAHGENIERIAIVGEETWRDDAMMFALAGLRKAPTRYFLPADLDRAHAWLTQAQDS
jgi:hypothetical protein